MLGFFFSSRRRHTICLSDWSSDVCSSDLVAHLTDEDQTRLELSIRHTGAGDVAAALIDSEINAFLAPDEDALARTIGRYLHQRGFLRFAEEIEIHSEPPPRAERLEADEIWTFGDGADGLR